MGVYVFGMTGVPIYEMLLIITLLNMVGLVFILLEVRKLKMLISAETGDLGRFERDIGEFERDEANLRVRRV